MNWLQEKELLIAVQRELQGHHIYQIWKPAITETQEIYFSEGTI